MKKNKYKQHLSRMNNIRKNDVQIFKYTNVSKYNIWIKKWVNKYDENYWIFLKESLIIQYIKAYSYNLFCIFSTFIVHY